MHGYHAQVRQNGNRGWENPNLIVACPFSARVLLYRHICTTPAPKKRKSTLHGSAFFWVSKLFIRVLYSRGLSNNSGFPPHIPRFFALAVASAALYFSSRPPNSAPLLASYVVARPLLSISRPTSLRKRKRRTETVATMRSYWSRL